MEVPLAAAIALLFGGAAYSILRPNLLRIVIGFGLLSNAVNLLMILCGGFRLQNTAPFVSDPNAVAGLMDPIPPDIILTAIVISFAVGALFLTICYVVYRDYGTDDPEALPAYESDEPVIPPHREQKLTFEE
ncbi:MAG TPA: sodium:proton antiporter [Candidatus Binatia bacterium]|nr:sodium:proton antiporter [Candidatus Binatia bacterium]